MRNDSIKEFTKAKREDLINQYQNEVNILKEYLPEQMTKEEVIEILDKLFEEIKPTSQKDMGKIMKELNPKISGRFDKGEASKLVKDKLSQI